MAISRGDLTGTKNGSNKNFTIPVTPIAGSEIIIHDGSALYPVAVTPVAGECKITGGTAVEVGLAPDSTDRLWYWCDT